jgi:sugar lactone lactonase YvrE
VFLDAVDGVPIPGISEMCPDGEGGLYFGTVDIPSIERGEKPRPAGLFHVAADGTARQLCDGLVFTNGLTLSPDRTLLYHNESFVGTFAYPILENGELGERTMLLEKDDCDGISLDVEGNLWITGFNSQDILRVSPAGDILDRLTVPSGTVTNLRFAGDGGRDLYVTTVPEGAGDELAAGRPPTEPNSIVYRAPSPVAGCPVGTARFRLT